MEHDAERLFDALCQATVSIVELDDLTTIFERIAETARELVGAQYAAVAMSATHDLPEAFIFDGIDEETAVKIPHPPEALGLLGAITEKDKPLRIPDVRRDARFSGFPESHPHMGSFIGVSITTGKRVYGRIYLTNKLDESEFNELDERILKVLSAHAAIAIENAQLLQESKRQQEQLENRNKQLAALDQATMAISGELTLEKVLQQIVNAARELVQAEYAALGVPNAEGYMDAFVHSGMSPETVEAIPHLPKGEGLLGAIVQERKPIRLPHLQDDPRSVGFPEGHPPMESFLGVPVLAGGEMLGNLYLTNKMGAAEFSLADQEMVELLAAHAAIAIQNARLYEQVGRLAIVEERTRIGMDLHDGVIQSIYAVGLTLESTRLVLQQNPEEADTLLAHSINALNDTIRDIRNFILDLRPHRFGGDLQKGLGRLVREFQANAIVPVTLTIPPDSIENLPTPVTRSLFLTTQEALANIARHAKATQVEVTFRRTDDHKIQLTIQDNGEGFDVQSKTYSVGHGLSNMRARADDLNGTCKIHSVSGEGTTITLTLPVRASDI